mgnify:CR=1 FL=1
MEHGRLSALAMPQSLALAGPGAAPAAPARAAVEVDPNAIRAELKSFEGLAEALKAVDDKAEPEVQGWAQPSVVMKAKRLADRHPPHRGPSFQKSTMKKAAAKEPGPKLKK